MLCPATLPSCRFLLFAPRTLLEDVPALTWTPVHMSALHTSGMWRPVLCTPDLVQKLYHCYQQWKLSSYPFRFKTTAEFPSVPSGVHVGTHLLDACSQLTGFATASCSLVTAHKTCPSISLGRWQLDAVYLFRIISFFYQLEEGGFINVEFFTICCSGSKPHLTQVSRGMHVGAAWCLRSFPLFLGLCCPLLTVTASRAPCELCPQERVFKGRKMKLQYFENRCNSVWREKTRRICEAAGNYVLSAWTAPDSASELEEKSVTW